MVSSFPNSTPQKNAFIETNLHKNLKQPVKQFWKDD